MKLIPFLRFGSARNEEEDDDAMDLPLPELIEPPADEETEQAEDEEKPEEEKEENGDDKPAPNDDDMLQAFLSVNEAFVDDSGLASKIEDVTVDELVQELRVMASAFGIRVAVPEDEAV